MATQEEFERHQDQLYQQILNDCEINESKSLKELFGWFYQERVWFHIEEESPTRSVQTRLAVQIEAKSHFKIKQDESKIYIRTLRKLIFEHCQENAEIVFNLTESDEENVEDANTAFIKSDNDESVSHESTTESILAELTEQERALKEKIKTTTREAKKILKDEFNLPKRKLPK